jgi:hypothetical protein
MSGPNYDQRDQNVNEQYNAGRDIQIDARHEENPYVEQEEFQSAGCLARGFMIIGGILIAIGFLAFFGGVIMGMMGILNFMGTISSNTAMPSLSFLSPVALAPLGLGVALIGMIVYAIGRMMARSAAYKNRMRSRQYSGRVRY